MTTEEIEIKQLERNVKDLQAQLQKSYIRIGEINSDSSDWYERFSKIKKLVRDFPNDQQLGKEIRNMINNESV